jgi:solute carrier family 25 aspartate/glutamate transporter 12/13
MTDLLIVMDSCERASKEELEKIFTKYATVERDGEFFMTHEDFVCHYLQLADVNCQSQTKLVLARVADTTRNGLISLSEFRAFESLLTSPDSVSQLAFKLFDIDNKGSISFVNFKLVLSLTAVHNAAPFDFNCPLVKQYFGSKRDRHLDYHDFTQLLQSLPTEHARQVFSATDASGSGSIPALNFVELMMRIRKYRMSPYVQENLLSVAGGGHTRNVSYPYFKGFNQFLGNLDILQKVVTVATRNTGSATHSQLLREARRYGQVTPLQVALLYQLCDLEHRRGVITVADFRKLLPRPSFDVYPPVSMETSTTDSSGQAPEVPPLLKSLEPLYRFSLGSIAGATGATAVYPIDLVKTRMQNQRGSLPGEIMYKSSIDCFVKVVRNEGVFGLYRGLLPQLVGVSPEKAIKLTMNDTMRDFLREKDGSLPLWKECVAGGSGGASQVIFTNPIEIVKIRLQVAGEMTETAKLGATTVVRDLGFFGLYKVSPLYRVLIMSFQHT